MRIKAWTEAYNPMTMGGSCSYPLAVETNADNWFDAGKGFMCGRIYSPDGKREAIVEMRSGAIVGTKAEYVIKDISECEDAAIMEKQIEDAIKRISSSSTKIVSEEVFWSTYRG